MQGKSKPLLRYLQNKLVREVARNQSFLLLGPRQVGKTTLLGDILRDQASLLQYNLQDPSLKLNLEKDPGALIRQVNAKKGHVSVYIDEAQKIPPLFDAAQLLIDQQKATFFFTGSSARKLRRGGVNLLPGRIKSFYLDPLLWGELGLLKKEEGIKSIPLLLSNINTTHFSILEAMVYGTLPGMIEKEEKDRQDLIQSYAHLYIEEEIRAEAFSRNIGAFSRFLELAAVESGTNPNLSKLSQESRVSVPTIKEYYSILEDTLVIERIDPYIKRARKRILSSSRYYFFDTGVRNALARFPMNQGLVQVQKGVLFEHVVILELIRRIRLLKPQYRIYYWRTSAGAEVDCIIETENELIPIEIKSSSQVRSSDLRGLRSFIGDYQDKVKRAFVVTMGERSEKIDNIITTIPWQYL